VSTYVDAGGAVKEWINSLTARLVGAGNPLPLGASLNQREGAASVPYAFLVELPAGLWGGAEHPSMQARISAQVYGPTKKSASDAAMAYAEELMTLVQGARVTLPESGATLAGADNVEGPQWFPDGEEPRYIVEADFLFL
jgi:hypothetical protein